MSNKVNYTYGGIFFVWDPEKAKSNMEKHAVSFKMAAEVFFDERSFISTDPFEEEERLRMIGRTEDGTMILFVVYVERLHDEVFVYRIISARKATRKEREQYGA